MSWCVLHNFRFILFEEITATTEWQNGKNTASSVTLSVFFRGQSDKTGQTPLWPCCDLWPQSNPGEWMSCKLLEWNSNCEASQQLYKRLTLTTSQIKSFQLAAVLRSELFLFYSIPEKVYLMHHLICLFRKCACSAYRNPATSYTWDYWAVYLHSSLF